MTRTSIAPAGNFRRAFSAALLGLILLVCAALKIKHNDRPFLTGADGGLYTDIAEHVRDGDGLVTDISLYNHGYPRFPHPTAIYPAWPLLYGAAGRLVPLGVAGTWLPTVGYFAALIFAYLWAAPLGRAGRRPGPWANPGHALVIFLGLNGKFFAYTSLPFTEGLGYALLFACLWRFRKIGGSPSLAHGVEMGVWLAALMLVRSHFLIVALAALLALGWSARRFPVRRGWLKPVVAAAVFVAALVPWYVRISRFVPRNRLAAIVRYDQARANDLLSPFRALAPAADLPSFVKDRLAGLGTAFSPTGESSYAANFHGLPYAFVLALVAAAGSLLIRRRKCSSQDAWPVAGHRGFEAAFLVLFSAGAFASLQLMHMDVAQPWLFGHRHALMMTVPFFLAWWLLARSRRLPAVVAAVAIGLYTVVASAGDCLTAGVDDTLAAERWKPVRQWLEERRPAVGADRPVVAASGLLPQFLAPQLPGFGFHGVYQSTTEEDLRTLFERLGAGLLILEDRDIGPGRVLGGVDPAWFERYFKPVARLPGYALFARQADRGGWSP